MANLKGRVLHLLFLCCALLLDPAQVRPEEDPYQNPQVLAERVDEFFPHASKDIQKILVESLLVLGKRRPREALQRAEQAVQAAREANDAASEAEALKWRAVCTARLGRKAESAASWKESAAAWERVGDRIRQLQALWNAAWFDLEDDPVEADRLLTQAIELGESEVERPLAAAKEMMAAALAFLTRDAGFTDQARELSLQALEIRELMAPDSLSVAETLGVLGILECRAGQTSLAESYHTRAIELAKAVAADQPIEYFSWLESVSDLAKVEVERRPVRDFYIVARDTMEGIPTGDPREEDLLYLIGNISYAAGDFALCWEYAKRRLELVEARVPDSEEAASHMGFIAGLAMGLENDAAATGLELRKLAILETLNSPRIMEPLNALGILSLRADDLTAAEDYFQRALSAFRKYHPGKEDPRHILQNLGVLAQAKGDYAEAEKYSRKAQSEKNLAILEHTRGNVAEATGYYQKVLAAIRGRKYPYVSDLSAAGGLTSIAHHLAEIGETHEAFETALRAEQLTVDHMRLTARTMAGEQALTYAYSTWRPQSLHLLLTLLGEHRIVDRAATRRAWDSLIRSRSLVLDELASRHRSLVGSGDPEVARLTYRLAAVRERLARLVVRGSAGQSSTSHGPEIEEARQAKEQAERALAEKSLSFRDDLERSNAGMGEVSAALPPGSALVGYVRYERHNLSRQRKPGEGHWENPPHYLALILRADNRAVEVVPLGPAEKIETRMAALRHQISLQALAVARSESRSESDYRNIGTELRRLIWGPIEPHVRNARRVFVVPDGELHLINLAALPVGQTEYLAETGPVIHYLSAERDLIPRLGPHENRGLLAMGAPSFSERSLVASLTPHRGDSEFKRSADLLSLRAFRGPSSACRQFQSMHFNPVPASLQEISEIAALWRKALQIKQGASANRLRGASPSKEATDIVTLTGTEASEAALKQQAPGKRLLHLATHGFFLGGRCGSVRQRGVRGGGKAGWPAARENPLLHSGLALAGANLHDAARLDGEDGILTAEEIASLDLTGVDWAVLSACDTGLGEVKAGEGVLGLRRAFQVAGARTVIMSLWPVEDESVRQWMERLYRAHFIQGLDTAESVHTACHNILRQRRLRKQSTHPFYWAGFVAAGDWR